MDSKSRLSFFLKRIILQIHSIVKFNFLKQREHEKNNTKNHGGIITVDSQEGKGSVFFVYLPALASKP